MSVGTYYKSIPYIIEELLQAKKVKIETEDGQLYVYDVSGRVPRLLFYTNNVEYR